MDFPEQWDSARAILGWGTIGDSNDFELVQIRGTYEEPRRSRQRSMILIKSEGGRAIAQAWRIDGANAAVADGFLRSDIEEVDALSLGGKVAVVLGDDGLGVWRTNGAHAGRGLDQVL